MCLFEFRPHLFDFKSLLQKDPNTRLSHAFELAYSNLNIEKLLDPEDVNTNRPDKKSVMMYVMCYFQALQNEELSHNSDAHEMVCLHYVTIPVFHNYIIMSLFRSQKWKRQK